MAEELGAEASMVCRRYQAASQFWNPVHDYWRRLMRTYRQEMEFKRDENEEKLYLWRSKLFMPEAFHLSETAYINIAEAIFAKENFFSILPGRGALDKERVFKTERILGQQLKQRQYQHRIMPKILEAVLTGNATTRTIWEYETRRQNRRRQRRKFNLFTGYDEFEEQVEIYDGPDFYPVAFYSFFPDPYTRPGEIDSAEYVCEDLTQSWADFMADAEYFDYLPEGLDWVRKNFKEGGLVHAEYDQRGFDVSQAEQRRVRLILYHDHDQVIYVASPSGSTEGAVVRRQDLQEVSPDRSYPYAVFQIRHAVDEGVNNVTDTEYQYFPGCFFSLGELHSLQDLNESMNALVNMRFDVAMLGMNPPWIMHGGAIVDETILEDGMRPGRIVTTESDFQLPLHQAIQQMQVQDYMGGAFAMLQQYLIETAKRSSGIEDVVEGRFSASKRTATDVMQSTANASTKFMHKAKNLVKSGMIPMLNKFIELNAEYMSPDTELYLTGRPDMISQNVSSEDIMRGCTLTIMPSLYYNKILRAKTLVEFLPYLLQYPLTRVDLLFRTMVEGLSEIFDDASAIIPEQADPMMAAQMKAYNQYIDQLSQSMRGTSGGTPGFGNEAENLLTDAGAEVRQRPPALA